MLPCPSRLELSRWEAHPEMVRPAELEVHLGECQRCSGVLADISEARSLLLGADAAEASRRAARIILETARQRRGGLRRWLKLLVPIFLVPVAAAVLVLGRASLPSHGNSVKGRIVVETYCKRGDQVFQAADGGDYLPGDQLRFAYTQDRPGFLLVFGLDDSGAVFPYYEENRLVGTPVTAGARVFLPGSVELDGHRGWERIYFLWSESVLSDDTVRAAIASALAAAHGDVRRTYLLDLPVEQVSLLLRRP